MCYFFFFFLPEFNQNVLFCIFLAWSWSKCAIFIVFENIVVFFAIFFFFFKANLQTRTGVVIVVLSIIIVAVGDLWAMFSSLLFSGWFGECLTKTITHQFIWESFSTRECSGLPAEKGLSGSQKGWTFVYRNWKSALRRLPKERKDDRSWQATISPR